MKRRFLAKSALSGVAVAVLASGCAVFSPVQTDVAYDPADGVPADLGKLALRDLVVVGGDGAGRISGSAINLGNEPLTVQVSVQPDQQAAQPPGGVELGLAPREQVDLSTRGLQLQDVAAKPGSIVTLNISTPQGGTTLVKVPVLPATGYYATVAPTPQG